MRTDAQRRPEYLTPKELAIKLGVYVSTVYRAIRRGELAAVRLAGRGAIRLHRSALEPRRAP